MSRKALETKRPQRASWWTWITNSDNQRTLAFIGTGLAVVVGALWTAYVRFSTISDPKPPVVAPVLVPQSTPPSIVVEQKDVQGDGNQALGVNTGTVSTNASDKTRKRHEEGK